MGKQARKLRKAQGPAGATSTPASAQATTTAEDSQYAWFVEQCHFSSLSEADEKNSAIFKIYFEIFKLYVERNDNSVVEASLTLKKIGNVELLIKTFKKNSNLTAVQIGIIHFLNYVLDTEKMICRGGKKILFTQHGKLFFKTSETLRLICCDFFQIFNNAAKNLHRLPPSENEVEFQMLTNMFAEHTCFILGDLTDIHIESPFKCELIGYEATAVCMLIQSDMTKLRNIPPFTKDPSISVKARQTTANFYCNQLDKIQTWFTLLHTHLMNSQVDALTFFQLTLQVLPLIEEFFDIQAHCLAWVRRASKERQNSYFVDLLRLEASCKLIVEKFSKYMRTEYCRLPKTQLTRVLPSSAQVEALLQKISQQRLDYEKRSVSSGKVDPTRLPPALSRAKELSSIFSKPYGFEELERLSQTTAATLIQAEAQEMQAELTLAQVVAARLEAAHQQKEYQATLSHEAQVLEQQRAQAEAEKRSSESAAFAHQLLLEQRQASRGWDPHERVYYCQLSDGSSVALSLVDESPGVYNLSLLMVESGSLLEYSGPLPFVDDEFPVQGILSRENSAFEEGVEISYDPSFSAYTVRIIFGSEDVSIKKFFECALNQLIVIGADIEVHFPGAIITRGLRQVTSNIRTFTTPLKSLLLVSRTLSTQAVTNAEHLLLKLANAHPGSSEEIFFRLIIMLHKNQRQEIPQLFKQLELHKLSDNLLTHLLNECLRNNYIMEAKTLISCLRNRDIDEQDFILFEFHYAHAIHNVVSMFQLVENLSKFQSLYPKVVFSIIRKFLSCFFDDQSKGDAKKLLELCYSERPCILSDIQKFKTFISIDQEELKKSISKKQLKPHIFMITFHKLPLIYLTKFYTHQEIVVNFRPLDLLVLLRHIEKSAYKSSQEIEIAHAFIEYLQTQIDSSFVLLAYKEQLFSQSKITLLSLRFMEIKLKDPSAEKLKALLDDVNLEISIQSIPKALYQLKLELLAELRDRGLRSYYNFLKAQYQSSPSALRCFEKIIKRFKISFSADDTQFPAISLFEVDPSFGLPAALEETLEETSHADTNLVTADRRFFVTKRLLDTLNKLFSQAASNNEFCIAAIGGVPRVAKFGGTTPDIDLLCLTSVSVEELILQLNKLVRNGSFTNFHQMQIYLFNAPKTRFFRWQFLNFEIDLNLSDFEGDLTNPLPAFKKVIEASYPLTTDTLLLFSSEIVADVRSDALSPFDHGLTLCNLFEVFDPRSLQTLRPTDVTLKENPWIVFRIINKTLQGQELRPELTHSIQHFFTANRIWRYHDSARIRALFCKIFEADNGFKRVLPAVTLLIQLNIIDGFVKGLRENLENPSVSHFIITWLQVRLQEISQGNVSHFPWEEIWATLLIAGLSKAYRLDAVSSDERTPAMFQLRLCCELKKNITKLLKLFGSNFVKKWKIVTVSSRLLSDRGFFHYATDILQNHGTDPSLFFNDSDRVEGHLTIPSLQLN